MTSQNGSTESRLQEVIAAFFQDQQDGRPVDRDEFLARHADLADELRAFFADHDKMTQAAAPVRDALANAAPAETFPQLFGDYELLEEIGRGGMGVVYKARQISLNRVVALKRIRAGQLASPEEVARFRREAEAAAGLDHPHIVPIHQVGEHAGQHYFTMKLNEGGNLNAHLARFADAKSTADLMIKIARAVHHAHQRGILHRDLKPGNILIDADGNPHVSDFGLAQPIEKEAKLTQSGAILGTPEYMAPEQARGEKGLTTAADVYGLGAILYVLLTGKPPFQGDYNWETLKKVVEEEPFSPRSINRQVDWELDAICLKCLEKRTTSRYVSAEALATELGNWLAGKPISVRATGPVGRTLKWARRRPAVAAFLATALLLLATFAVGGPVVAVRENILREAADDALNISKSATKRAQDEENIARELARRLQDRTRDLEKQTEIAKQHADAATRNAKDADEQKSLAVQKAKELGEKTQDLDRQFQKTRQNLYAAQVSRAGSNAFQDPAEALKLLTDLSACPADLREFSWRHAAARCNRERLVLRNAELPRILLPEKNLMAVLRYKKHTEIWDLNTARLVKTLVDDPDGKGLKWESQETKQQPDRSSVKGDLLAWSPDWERCFVRRPDGKYIVWNAARKEEEFIVTALEANRSDFSEDGRYLRFREFQNDNWDIWDLRARALAGKTDGYPTFIPGSTRVVVTTRNGCELRDLASREVLGSTTNWGPPRAVPGGRLLMFPNGKRDQGFAFYDAFSLRHLYNLVPGNRDSRETTFSADGRFMIGSSFDQVIVWELGSDEATQVLPRGHLACPGGRFVVCEDAKEMQVWDTKARTKVVSWDTPGDTQLQFSTKGRYLVAVSGGNITVADLAKAKIAWSANEKWPKDQRFFTAFAMSPDESTLALGDNRGSIQYRELPTGKSVYGMWGDAPPIHMLEFCHDGKTLAAFRIGEMIREGKKPQKGELIFYNVGSSIPVVRHVFEGDCSDIQIYAHQRLMIFREQGRPRFWDLNECKELTSLKGEGFGQVTSLHQRKRMAGHWQLEGEYQFSFVKDIETGRELVLRPPFPTDESGPSPQFSPDGSMVAKACAVRFGGRAVRFDIVIWNAHTGTVRSVIKGADFHFTFSPDGRTLVSGKRRNYTDDDFNMELGLWDTTSGEPLATLQGPGGASGPSGPAGSFTSLLFSPTGDTLIAMGRRTMVYHAPHAQAESILGGEDSKIDRIALSPDGKTLYSEGWAGQIRAWNTDSADHRVLADFGNVHRSYNVGLVQALTVSPDGKLLGVNAWHGTMLLDTASGKTVHKFSDWFVPRFSIDGKRVLAVVRDPDHGLKRDEYTLRSWDTATFKELTPGSAAKKYGSRQIWPISFSRYGYWSRQGHVFIFDSQFKSWTLVDPKSAEQKTLTIREPVYDAEFSPDARKIALLVSDEFERDVGHFRIFDADSGRLQWQSPKLPLFANIAFDGNGNVLAAAAKDGCIYVWDTTDGRLIAQVAVGATRDLAVAAHGQTIYYVAQGGTIHRLDLPSRSSTTIQRLDDRLRLMDSPAKKEL